MKTRLSPYYIDLIYEACLKSFWRKKTLSKFLRQSGIAERFLNSWISGETKREFLDRLFEKLPKSDKGRAALLGISNYLMEQRNFSHSFSLKKWDH